jgi:hypothetical protein
MHVPINGKFTAYFVFPSPGNSKHSHTTQPFVPSYSRLTTQLEYTVMQYLNNDTDYNDRPTLCYCSHYLNVTGKVNNKITSELAYKR